MPTLLRCAQSQVWSPTSPETRRLKSEHPRGTRLPDRYIFPVASWLGIKSGPAWFCRHVWLWAHQFQILFDISGWEKRAATTEHTKNFTPWHPTVTCSLHQSDRYMAAVTTHRLPRVHNKDDVIGQRRQIAQCGSGGERRPPIDAKLWSSGAGHSLWRLLPTATAAATGTSLLVSHSGSGCLTLAAHRRAIVAGKKRPLLALGPDDFEHHFCCALVQLALTILVAD